MKISTPNLKLKTFYKLVHTFIEKNQNLIFFLFNFGLLFLLSFFFPPIMLLIGSVLWGDLFLFCYLVFFFNIPLVPICCVLFAFFRCSFMAYACWNYDGGVSQRIQRQTTFRN